MHHGIILNGLKRVFMAKWKIQKMIIFDFRKIRPSHLCLIVGRTLKSYTIISETKKMSRHCVPYSTSPHCNPHKLWVIVAAYSNCCRLQWLSISHSNPLHLGFPDSLLRVLNPTDAFLCFTQKNKERQNLQVPSIRTLTEVNDCKNTVFPHATQPACNLKMRVERQNM